MLVKELDIFINAPHQLLSDDLMRRRTWVAFLLLLLGIGVTWTLVTLALGMPIIPDPALAIVAICVILLSLNYIGLKLNLTVPILNSCVCIMLFLNSLETGGIYSTSIKWFVVIFFISVLFVSRVHLIFWGLICISLITYLFYIHPGDAYFIIPVDRKAILLEKVLFYLTAGIFIFIIYRTQEVQKKDVEKKNDELENYSSQLIQQSDNLELLTHQLEESNERLVDFAHSTSHDLMQPINTISSFAELISKDIEQNKVSDKTIQMLKFVKESSVKIKSLIKNSLERTKLDNQIELNYQKHDMNDLVKEVLGRLAYQINQTNAKIEVSNLPSVYLDGIQISRVFQNLISNAMKYTKSGQRPTLKIYCKSQKSEFLFTIEDKGKGIADGMLDKIFEPYFQTNSRSQIGYGIGLGNCKKLIEDVGGRIWAESELGQYTKIYFTIPNKGHLSKNPLPI